MQRFRLTLVVVGIAVFFTSACGASHNNAMAKISPTTTMNFKTAQDATATCNSFSLIFLTSDTQNDQSSIDAERRAALRYGTLTLQKIYNELVLEKDTDFIEAKSHNAKYQLTAQTYMGDDIQPDTASLLYRSSEVSGQITGTHAWSRAFPSTIIQCTLIRVFSRWLVDSIELQVSNVTDDFTKQDNSGDK